MAEIPLRSYLHEIEKHIESGRTDQAIAHSRYILQSYPKYVDGYRLLGKAYLESQHYGDAGDIFQRVLSSVPDDFVSHVGMSIIREDEGNLDEAIWHLERAFEVQPSNSAVQEELRRLYGRRDNVEPPKIRLTRGALARMYYKGELYQQAISEIRAALGENPNRFDLQALLAEIYQRTNQTVEAADTALAVLRRLPNCLIANRVMIQVLAGSDRETERKTYQQRLAHLDPYSAYTTPEDPEAEAVSEQKIKLEKLDWKPEVDSLGTGGQPAWAASLGVDLEDLAPQQETDTLPEWLTDVTPQPEEAGESITEPPAELSFEEEIDQTGAAAEKSEEEIPDWLRDAGWEPATGEGRAAEAAFQFESSAEGEPAEDKLAAAEIPDWLIAMAPPLAQEEAAEEEEEDVTPWLEKLMHPAVEPGAEIPSPEITALEGPEVEGPEWLKAAGVVGAAAIGAGALEWTSEEEPGASIPERPLAEPAALATEARVEPPGEALTETPLEQEITAAAATEPVEQIPEWLSEIQSAAAELESEEPEGQLPTTPEIGFVGATAVAAAGLVASEIPDWLKEEETNAVEPVAEKAPSASELPNWLLEMQAAGAELPEISIDEVEPEQAAEELPDWLQAAESGVILETTVSESEEPEELGAAKPTAELPEWLREIEYGTEAEGALETSAESEVAERPTAELPDWLLEEELAEGAAAVELTETHDEAEALESAPTELPDWLLETMPVVGAAAGMLVETPEEEEALELPAAEEAVVGELAEIPEEEAALELPAAELPDWLLEAEPAEGAAVGELAESPEEEEALERSLAELPDWLLEAEPAEGAAVGKLAESPEEEEALERSLAELPDWLLEEEPVESVMGDELAEVVSEEEAFELAPAELPDWLKEMKPVDEREMPVIKTEPVSELPEWLRTAQLTSQEETPIETEALEALADTQPIRVKPISEPAPFEFTPQPVQEPVEMPQEQDEFESAFAWLMGLQMASKIVQPTESDTLEAAGEAVAVPTEEYEPVEKAVELVEEERIALEGEQPIEPVEFLVEEAATLETEAPIETAERLEGEEIQLEAETQETQEELWTPETAPSLEITSTEEEQTVSEVGQAEPSLDQEAAFAWLESLAVKQGASEALLLEPEERLEEMPEWVRQEALAGEADLVIESQEPLEEQAVSREEEAVLQEIEAEEVFEPEITLKKAALAELMLEEVLQEAPTAIEGEQPVIEELPEIEAELTTEEIPPLEVAAEAGEAAVEQAYQPEAVSEEAAAETIPELPDWLTESAISPREELEWTPPPLTQRRYDLNLASLSELERLPGVGFIAAQQITTYREQNGPYSSIEDLLNVPGISLAMVEGVRDNLFVTPAPESETAAGKPAMFPEESGIAPELTEARQQLAEGQLLPALGKYNRMIEANQELERIIQDLQEASTAFPEQVAVWQELGDAYLRTGQIHEALRAYIKAEEML